MILPIKGFHLLAGCVKFTVYINQLFDLFFVQEIL